MKEGKQISVRNQKIVNFVEVQISDLKQTLQLLGKKSSINNFKQYTTKLHSIYGQLQIVFSDQNFSEVYDHVKKLLMNYQMLFISMLERIDNYGRIQRDYQKKLSEFENKVTQNSTPQDTKKKQAQPTKIKSAFSKQQVNSIQQTIEAMKYKRMGGIHLYNQNYVRGIEGQQLKTSKQDLKTQKRQFKEETNSLLNQMDEAQIHLRLQSDQIDNFLALRRGKQNMFNHVSYSADLEEIAHFFKETQDEAIDFLNTSKSATSANQYTQQFNGVMSELKAQKEIQSANLIFKINEIVQFMKKRNAEVQNSIQGQFQKLKKLKQEMNKKKAEVAVQTTHDFTEQIKKLQAQLTEESQKYRNLLNFKQQTNKYQDQYYQLLKQIKVKQVQVLKYQTQLRQKVLYIENLQKNIRIKRTERVQITKSPNNPSAQVVQSEKNELNQLNQKSPTELNQSQHLDSSQSKSFRKKKPSQMMFLKEFGLKRDSNMSATDTEASNSKDPLNKSYLTRQSSFLNSTLENQKIYEVNQNDMIEQQQQFTLPSKRSTRKTIKVKQLRKVADFSQKSSSQIASSNTGIANTPNQQPSSFRTKDSDKKQMQTTQYKANEKQNKLVNNFSVQKSAKTHKRQPSIQRQTANQSSLQNKGRNKAQIKYQTSMTQQNSAKQINYMEIQKDSQNSQIPCQKEHLQQLKPRKLQVNVQNNQKSKITNNKKQHQTKKIKVDLQKNKQYMDYRNKIQNSKQRVNQTICNQQFEQQIEAHSYSKLENSQQDQQSDYQTNSQRNCIPSIEKIQQDKQITKTHKQKEEKLCLKINVIDIDHNKFEQKYQICYKKQQKKIVNKYSNKSRHDFNDQKHQEFNIFKQSKRKNNKGNKQQRTSDSIYHLKQGQNAINSQHHNNSLKTSGKCLNYKNASNYRLPLFGRQQLITSEVSVTIYPFVASTHHPNTNFRTKTQQQFQEQFLNIIKKLDKNTLIQQHQYQEQSVKQTARVSGHINKNKYSVARQKTTNQDPYQVMDVSKKYKIDKNTQLILKKKFDKKQIYFTQYSSIHDQNQEFLKLKQLWKQKCCNIQEQKQEVIRKHLESCGTSCIHLQRYLQIFDKFSQNERKTLKIHIQNINKYQSEFISDLQEQADKQRSRMHVTSKLGKQNKLSQHANTTKLVKASMRQTARNQQNKSVSKNFGVNIRDLSLPHVKK